MIFLKHVILLHKYTAENQQNNDNSWYFWAYSYLPPIFIGPQILIQIYIDLVNGQNQSQKRGNPHFSGKVACLWFLSNLAHRKFLHRPFKRI